MPARKIKSLKKELGYQAHREHRSKKGRHYEPKYRRIVAFKKKKEELRIQELDRELESTGL